MGGFLRGLRNRLGRISGSKQEEEVDFCDQIFVSPGGGKGKGINPSKLRSSGNWNRNEVPYSWREGALCTSSFALADETRGRDINLPVLRDKVQLCLKAKALRAKPPVNPKQYVRWMLKRIQLVQKTGGPRMRVVWWRTLSELGRIPRWPQDKQHILDLESLATTWLKKCDKQGRMDGRYLYIWMLSHRWERPHFCEECLTGCCAKGAEAHPDSVTNIKARTVGKWGEHQYEEQNVGPMSPEDYYIWIDFTSIDQDDAIQKLAGIEMLPLYVACCGSGLVLYLPNDAAMGYEERAWTAIERILAYTYGVSPVLKKIDSGYIKGAPRWTSKLLEQSKPKYWVCNDDGKLCFRMTDPLMGRLTCVQDAEKIEHLKKIIETTPPIDFHAIKENLTLEQTLFRVEDTCRERATVTQRKRGLSVAQGGRKLGASGDGEDFAGGEDSDFDKSMMERLQKRWEGFRSASAALCKKLGGGLGGGCRKCARRIRGQPAEPVSSISLGSHFWNANLNNTITHRSKSGDEAQDPMTKLDSSDSCRGLGFKPSVQTKTPSKKPARMVSFSEPSKGPGISFNFGSEEEKGDGSSSSGEGVTKKLSNLPPGLGNPMMGVLEEEEEDDSEEDSEDEDDAVEKKQSHTISIPSIPEGDSDSDDSVVVPTNKQVSDRADARENKPTARASGWTRTPVDLDDDDESSSGEELACRPCGEIDAPGAHQSSGPSTVSPVAPASSDPEPPASPPPALRPGSRGSGSFRVVPQA